MSQPLHKARITKAPVKLSLIKRPKGLSRSRSVSGGCELSKQPSLRLGVPFPFYFSLCFYYYIFVGIFFSRLHDGPIISQAEFPLIFNITFLTLLHSGIPINLSFKWWKRENIMYSHYPIGFLILYDFLYTRKLTFPLSVTVSDLH